MKCVFCGIDGAHDGTRKCWDSTACELRCEQAENEKLRAELDEARRCIDADSHHVLAAGVEVGQLRAEVEKLRGVLWQVRDAMTATDQAPDGEDDPRRPLASAVWRATGVRR